MARRVAARRMSLGHVHEFWRFARASPVRTARTHASDANPCTSERCHGTSTGSRPHQDADAEHQEPRADARSTTSTHKAPPQHPRHQPEHHLDTSTQPGPTDSTTQPIDAIYKPAHQKAGAAAVWRPRSAAGGVAGPPRVPRRASARA